MAKRIIDTLHKLHLSGRSVRSHGIRYLRLRYHRRVTPGLANPFDPPHLPFTLLHPRKVLGRLWIWNSDVSELIVSPSNPCVVAVKVPWFLNERQTPTTLGQNTTTSEALATPIARPRRPQCSGRT